MTRGTHGLAIVYALLTAERPLSVADLCERTGCSRKTVYSNIDAIECAGFCTEVTRKRMPGSRGAINLYTASLRG